GENAGDRRHAMVETRVFGEAHEGAGGACLGVGGAVKEAAEASVDDEPGAHWAGFERDGKGAVVQAPVAEREGGLADGDELGVGGGVLVEFAAVVALADEAA